MSRLCGRAVLLCTALPACMEPSFVEIADPSGAQTVLFATFRQGALLDVVVVDRRNEADQVPIASEDGAELVALVSPYSIEELQVASGPLRVAVEDSRAMPEPISVYRALGGQLVAAEDSGVILHLVRLPAFDVSACNKLQHCLSAGPAELCVPCARPAILPPIEPAPPTPPSVTIPTCLPGERRFLAGAPCRPQPSCPPGWPAAPPGAIHAEAGAVGGDGTEARPFGDLATAIAATPDGGTVLVRGTFDTSVIIDRRALSIRGVCPSEAMILVDSGDALLTLGSTVSLQSLSLVAPGAALSAQGGSISGRELVLSGDLVGLLARSSSIALDTVAFALSLRAIETSGGWLGLEAVDIETGPGTALLAFATTIEADGLWVRTTTTANAMTLVSGSTAKIEHAIFEGPFDTAIELRPGTRLDVSDGRFLGVIEGVRSEHARATFTRVEMFGAIEASVVGILAISSTVAVFDAWFHDIDGDFILPVPTGIRAKGTIDLIVERALLEGCARGIGVSPEAEKTDRLQLRDIRARQSRLSAIHIDLYDKKPADIIMSRIAIAEVGGVALHLNHATRPTIEDLTIENVTEIAFSAQIQLTMVARRVRIRGAAGWGLQTHFTNFSQIEDASVRLEDIDISDIRDGQGGGIGLQLLRGRFAVDRFSVSNAVVGVLIGDPDKTALMNGSIEGYSSSGYTINGAPNVELFRQVSFAGPGVEVFVNNPSD